MSRTKKKRKRRVKLGIPEANSNGGLHWCFIGEKAHSRLREAFVQIIHLLCEREPGFTHEHKKQLFPVSYGLKELGAFDSETPDKLRELFNAIDEALENARTNGMEEGSNILMRLAQGTATIQEFNEATINE